jgi:hypothetical protein
MNRYLQSKIYKIYSDLPELNGIQYIGSTIEPTLARRMASHRGKTKRGNTSLLYSTMRTHDVENFKIELIEMYPCLNKDELHERANFWIKLLDTKNNNWNSDIPSTGLTRKEYRIKNKVALNLKRASKATDDIKNKSFHCIGCEHSFTRQEHLKRHLKTNKHKLQQETVIPI